MTDKKYEPCLAKCRQACTEGDHDREVVRANTHADPWFFFFFSFLPFPYMNPDQTLSIGYSYDIQCYSKLQTGDRQWKSVR